MQSGKLRHKVTIERRINGQNERGGPKETYEPWLVDIWAEVLMLGPREQFGAQQVLSEINSKIRVRFRPGITAKMRVRWERRGGSPTDVEFYDIAGPPIEVQGRQNEIWLLCVRRDAEGYRTGERT